MNRFFRFLPDFLIRGRLLVLAALFAATGYLGSRIPDIETNFATERMFHVEDSRRLDYERAAGIFGKDDNLLLILLEVPEPAAGDAEAPRDIFDRRVIDEIGRLGEAIGEIDGVTRVIDVADAVEMYETEGGFRVGRLIEEVPEDPAALAALKRRVLAHRLHARRLVSEDGRLAAMLVEIDAERFPLDQDRYAVVVDVQRLLGMDTGSIAESVYPKDREPPEAIPPSPLLRATMTGIPALRYAYLDLIESDQKRFLPFVVGMMLLVSAFLFRGLQGVLLPFAMVTVSLTWAMGWFPILGKPIDLISTILPTLLVVYGVADSIHLIGRYHELYAETGDKIGSLKRTIRDLGVACFLTSLTTAVGFGSLYISKMQIIRDFGLLAAVGVMGAYVVTIFLLPIALYYWRAPKRVAQRKAADGLSHRLLAALADFDIRHAKPILLVSAAILAVSIYGVTKAEVVTRILEDIDPRHPTAHATRVADARLGGILPLTILFEGPPEAFKEPENLRRVAEVEAFMKSLPETGTASSIADMVGLMNEAVAPEGAEGFRIPDLRGTVAEFLFLFSL
ncbi:MAG: MMPL family transporter, partial [Candidatus Methylomirabilis sp.]|nr:MMPL family transporter [Deltaproteobacteria bacterium]